MKKAMLARVATYVIAGLVLVSACGQSQDETTASPSATSPTTSSSTAPQSSAAPKPKAEGGVTFGGMTITVPETWVDVVSDANEATFADMKFCEATTNCPSIQFIDFALIKAARPSNPPVMFEEVIANQCSVMGVPKASTDQPLTLVGIVDIGGEKAQYYEQTVCSADKDAKQRKMMMYAWYMPSRERAVMAVSSAHGALDIATLRNVLDEAEWE